MKNNTALFHGKPRSDSLDVESREEILTLHNLYCRYHQIAEQLVTLDPSKKDALQTILKQIENEIAKITDLKY
jgi:hypothetical protein